MLCVTSVVRQNASLFSFKTRIDFTVELTLAIFGAGLTVQIFVASKDASTDNARSLLIIDAGQPAVFCCMVCATEFCVRLSGNKSFSANDASALECSVHFIGAVTLVMKPVPFSSRFRFMPVFCGFEAFFLHCRFVVENLVKPGVLSVTCNKREIVDAVISFVFADVVDNRSVRNWSEVELPYGTVQTFSVMPEIFSALVKRFTVEILLCFRNDLDIHSFASA